MKDKYTPSAKRPAPTLPKTWKPTEPVSSPPKPKVNLGGHEVKRTFSRDEASKAKPMPDVDLGSFHKPTEKPASAKPAVVSPKLPDASKPVAKPDSPKTKELGLDDVYAVLDDKYAAFPGFKSANAITRASSEEVEIRLPDHRSVIVNRKKIRECFHIEQLRSYVESMIG